MRIGVCIQAVPKNGMTVIEVRYTRRRHAVILGAEAHDVEFERNAHGFYELLQPVSFQVADDQVMVCRILPQGIGLFIIENRDPP